MALEIVKGGDALLNAGCGTGELNYYLRDRFKENYGFDISRSDIATAKLLNKDNNIIFSVGDILQIDHKDNYFDTIVCSEVLEHVADRAKAMKELKRVLKNNGLLVISVPHDKYSFFYDPINYILERTLKKHLPIGAWGFGHYKLFSDEGLKSLAEREGLKIEKFYYITHAFAGLMENYTSSLLQPLLKSNSKNQGGEAKLNKEKKIGFNYNIPLIFKKISNFIFFVDKFFGRKSKKSVGLFMVCKRIN